jgi:hypothetical protein
MALDSTSPRSRRAVLAAAAGAAAASVVAAVVRPAPTAAATYSGWTYSGTTRVRAGMYWVDVNAAKLNQSDPNYPFLPGTGLLPNGFATLQRYRAGVYVAAVRPNYPSAGQMRIYLNKRVASSIPVAWVALVDMVG